jgi:hypothetical protein
MAAAMFERGATMKEVKDTVGDTMYNLLRRLEKQGHRITKQGSLFKLNVKHD